MTRTLLAVFAHPDDETFGPGGTLARYAAGGAAVHLICATRGEAGESDLADLGDCEDLACRREEELRCAVGILGLAEIQQELYFTVFPRTTLRWAVRLMPLFGVGIRRRWVRTATSTCVPRWNTNCRSRHASTSA